MIRKRAKLTILLLLCSLSFLNAQMSNQIQPKIMVMPRVPDGVDPKTFYDTSQNLQIAIAKINEAFLKREANLRSFDQALKQVKENALLNKVSGNSEDLKSAIIQQSGADIYVETKLFVNNHSGRGNAKSVTVILEAFQAGTANNLSSRTAKGPMFQTEDIGTLTMMAVDTLSESFLNLLQLKFNDIVANGQSVFVQFTTAPNSKYTFDSEVGTGGKILSEIIEDWFAAHSVKGVYNSQGVAGNTLIISDARIPLKNPANPNANYTGQNFYTDILKYFRTLKMGIKREISTNNKILITIE